MATFKKGIFHASPVILVISLLILTALPFRENIHATINTTALHLGINLNNIENDDYVDWIKSQTPDFNQGKQAIFLNKDVLNQSTVAGVDILGQQIPSSGEKWVEVDLSDQRLYMKEGNANVGHYLV